MSAQGAGGAWGQAGRQVGGRSIGQLCSARCVHSYEQLPTPPTHSPAHPPPPASLLRDYFDAEFRGALAGRLPFAYDLERVVDDFVLFCMLVGNDFLPPLPTVDINEGALPPAAAACRWQLAAGCPWRAGVPAAAHAMPAWAHAPFCDGPAHLD